MRKLLSIATPLVLSIFLLICKNFLMKPSKDMSFNVIEEQSVESSLNNNNSNKNLTVSYFYPFTGEMATKDEVDKKAFMAIVENSKDARPQSGLSKADIVFETMAEGGIPRFIALFQKNTAKEIGPIRSARSYFLEISKDYNLPFAHCGGSQESLDEIKKGNTMSMNEMANGRYYWRDKSRKAPHNLYTSSENLFKLIDLKRYSANGSNASLMFNEDYWKTSDLPLGNRMVLKLNKFYTTYYEYKDGKYLKYMDNILTIDKAYNEPIKIDNIVIQKTSITLSKDGVHVDIPLKGRGEAIIFSKGKYTEGFWEKKDEHSSTVLIDSKGNIIPLSSGNTWWNIIDSKNLIEIS